MNGWTMELLEDSSIKDALALIDPALVIVTKHEIDSLAHTVLESPPAATTEGIATGLATPFVTIMGSSVKPEGALVTGETLVASGNPMILTNESIAIAAKQACDAWREGAVNYWREVCRKAGSGAHIFLIWRKHPEFVLWSDWGSYGQRVCIAMRGRLAFETLEDGQPWPYPNEKPGRSSMIEPSSINFFAINKAFAE